MERSAPWTCTEAVAVLLPGFGSVAVSLTVTEFVIVEPTTASGLTETTTVKLTEDERQKRPLQNKQSSRWRRQRVACRKSNRLEA